MNQIKLRYNDIRNRKNPTLDDIFTCILYNAKMYKANYIKKIIITIQKYIKKNPNQSLYNDFIYQFKKSRHSAFKYTRKQLVS